MSTTVYEAYRAIRERILSAAAGRIPQANAASQARALGVWHHKEVRVGNEAQFQLVLDLAVFGPVGGHSRALDREAKAGDYPDGSEEARILAALSRAHFTLFRVGATHPEGGVMAEDLLRGTALHIQDQMLAREEAQGVAFAGRLMRLEGFEMTCGALAPVTDEVVESLLGRPAPVQPIPRFLPMLTPLVPEDVAVLRAAAAAEDFPARVYRTALEHGLLGPLPA
ncbi:hypothetical protein KTR66_09485 [Roseococcus sp. SDR]|uniref:hypothetical protein n=1 Tax=Roseococcus sp. SDR TaxID=2835532 RepID=UPI001BCCA609|nr:hypothetical protein [Roseococcus sp. SDR]MBS7790228.1 hypothetical protein [Roseococcus sp. SDR]MBV1845542.1 hypothetical protein [Roseococcus sp. SDR]